MLKPRTFSAPKDVSQPTKSNQELSASAPLVDYMSFAGDGLSEKHRVPSTVSMTSLCSPTHGKCIYNILFYGMLGY